MEIRVKNLKDEYGNSEYIFYESGNFSKPIMILADGYAKKLFERLKEEMKKEDWRYGRHS